jgi:hypothetical protein
MFGGPVPVETSKPEWYAEPPCYKPTRDELGKDWTKWNSKDDESELVNLSFPFEFYGKIYNQVYVADNGFLTFENTFKNNYLPSSFPSGLSTPMIAPFWADVETANIGGRGNIYYKDFGEVFSVIWDQVGYYTNGTNVADRTNNFQVVISKSSNTRLPDLSNICFCYQDMEWTNGDKSNGKKGFLNPDIDYGSNPTYAATVGITKGVPESLGVTTYAQMGRFGYDGSVFTSVSSPSGVDWLDFLGSTQYQNPQNPRKEFCFNARPNFPPVCQGCPLNDELTIPCGGNLPEYKFAFTTPEIYQFIEVQILQAPSDADWPVGLIGEMDGVTAPTDVRGIRFEWLNVNFNKYQGKEYVFVFEACDNAQDRLCITKTITIKVGECGGGDTCNPDKCTPITDSECLLDRPKPVCTPWRSPEHCDPQYSFPLLISNRYQMIKDGIDEWFPYTDDRAGAYSFTRSSGENAPELYCCVTSVNDLLGPSGNPNGSACFDSSPAWGVSGGYVIRAEGHHTGSGILVFPQGIDPNGAAKPELISGGAMTITDVRNFLNGLSPTPKKILVEKFISGSTPGPSLPDEYKFHMFNGKIGSISAFLNRGTDCSCYGEYSEDWECLHANGCFVPALPGQPYQNSEVCYEIDFEAGSKDPFPVKGDDLCGPVDRPEGCLFDKMKEIAIKLSKLIGVYVRIDMFVSADKKIYVQEYTYNHLGGARHCASKYSDECDGIDSCFLGRLWQDAGGDPDLGGPVQQLPPVFGDNYGDKTDAEQCAVALGQPVAVAQSPC